VCGEEGKLVLKNAQTGKYHGRAKRVQVDLERSWFGRRGEGARARGGNTAERRSLGLKRTLFNLAAKEKPPWPGRSSPGGVGIGRSQRNGGGV